jgi:TPR repeat protein
MKSKLLAIIAIAVLFVGLSLGTPAYADFQKGWDAYDRKDYATALKEWEPLADQGDVFAQSSLGGMYRDGLGVIQDYKKAVKWYRLAADQGYAAAQFDLGLSYATGQGVIQDYKEAIKWHRLAAEQGNALAQYALGFMYRLGYGAAQDNLRAHMWFNIAASQGGVNAASSRDMAAKDMTSSQIEKAQGMARECVAKNYKDC